MDTINEKRKTIEQNISKPIVVSTSSLREKIKQKWESIHFYLIENELVRIKTYPYKNISSRTEEFYLDNGQLILAVIEDDGSGERGKSIEVLDKLYYFENEEVIKEIRSEKEQEYNIKSSDAEELLVELHEYLSIYKSHKRNDQ